jgi:hypothetical protein
MSHAEPYLLRTFAGKPEKLATAVEAMLAGQEVTLPCMVDGNKDAIQLRTARIQRMKASLKIQEYDSKRDFAGWGGEDFRAIAGMPGFTHYGALARMDGGAGGVAAADFDNDGKVDFCLYGPGKVALLHNAASSANEVSTGVEGGARAASWADCNGDGKPDLLLATPAGPRLLLNQSSKDGPRFRDASGALPEQPYFHLTAAAWIDYDGDKKPDILAADGFRGLRLWRNVSTASAKPLELALGAWKIIGPFENANNVGFDAAYPPEKELKFDAKYPGKGGFEATWREQPFTDGQINSVKVFRDDLHAFMVVYLYRELDANIPAEVPISLGNGGPIKLWLNGQLVVSDNNQRQPAPDQVQAKLKLKAGKNRLLLKCCYVAAGRSYYFAAKPPEQSVPRMFEDVSEKVGLGERGVGGSLKGDHLAVADVNADSRPDFLFSAGGGLLVLNTPQGFVAAKDSGIAYAAGRVIPAFGDFDGDKHPDLFVPQHNSVKLFRNDGKGKFTDVTARSGALAEFKGDAACGAWASFGASGRQDLFVGCLKGPNRYFRNKGDGTFTDAGDELGLYQKVFNTRGLALLDFNKDGVPDVVLNNEGQESALLLSNPARVSSAAGR